MTVTLNQDEIEAILHAISEGLNGDIFEDTKPAAVTAWNKLCEPECRIDINQ